MERYAIFRFDESASEADQLPGHAAASLARQVAIDFGLPVDLAGNEVTAVISGDDYYDVAGTYLALSRAICSRMGISTLPDATLLMPEDVRGDIRLKWQIEELDFSVRTFNLLRRSRDIRSIGELIRTRYEELENTPNIGEKTLAEIEETLAERDLPPLAR